jgi:cation transport ATPase
MAKVVMSIALLAAGRRCDDIPSGGAHTFIAHRSSPSIRTEIEIPIDQVGVGEVVIVRPGE